MPSPGHVTRGGAGQVAPRRWDAAVPPIDLACREFGGSVLAVSDESFGDKERLIAEADPVEGPRVWTPRGLQVDGWETRRGRGPAHQWAVIRLGVPGRISDVVIDTTQFRTNYPVTCSVEAAGADWAGTATERDGTGFAWEELVPPTPLAGNSRTAIKLQAGPGTRYTHVKVNIFPDGGIARVRVLGRAVPDPRWFDRVTPDLASPVVGGSVVSCSRTTVISASNLIRPESAADAGDGWATRRRRVRGRDWVVVRLAATAHVHRLEIDTTHFKYNGPEEVSVDRWAPSAGADGDRGSWQPLVPRRTMPLDTRYWLQPPIAPPLQLLRLNAFPDAGISRLRVLGWITPADRLRLGLTWLCSLPRPQCLSLLRDDCGLSTEQAEMVASKLMSAPSTAVHRAEWWGTFRDSGLAPTSLAGIVEGPSG